MTGTSRSFVKDIMGAIVAVGDTIAYPQRKGASMWMEIGRVLEIQDHIMPVSYPQQKPEHALSITVRKLNQRTGTITRIDRIVKVNKD